MTDLRRLKFAYARGARIQFLTAGGEWVTDSVGPTWSDWIPHRIHPDDAHLEYGPLSTALQEQVIWADYKYTAIHQAAHKVRDTFLSHGERIELDYTPGLAYEELRCFFDLFVSEPIADEGL